MKIIATRIKKIHSGFEGVIVRTTKAIMKINHVDKSVKNLLINWLVSLPWAYFEELFMNSNSWNQSLSALFKGARVVNGEDCGLITQAFFLWHLKELMETDDKYKKFSVKDIEIWINRRIPKGTLVTYRLKKFRKNLQHLPPDEWHLRYINEIFHALYPDNEKTAAIIRALEHDSNLMHSLNTYHTKVIRTAKLIDAQE